MGFVDESGGFISLADCPFGRRGSYLTVYLNKGASVHFGRSYVYIGTCRGAALAMKKTRLFNLHPLYQGERVPFATIMKPAELILRTLYGDIRICIAENQLMLFKAENGLGLRFTTTEELDRITKPRGKTAWETVFQASFDTVIHSITGKIDAYAPWEWDRLRCGRCKIDLLPDENGVMVGSLEEFKLSGYVRESYPTYEDGLTATNKDWETFLNNIPKLQEKYEPLRAPAAWNLWSFLVSPSGNIKHNLLYMHRCGPASQWQHTYQAVAFANNVEYGWEQMLVSFDQQSATGQLPDFYDDNRGNYSTIRPPIQGWALKLMKRLGYYDKLSKEKLCEFYPKLAAWANWFDKYRIEDGVDGLPHYEHSDESGMEDGSTFRENCMMVTPDLPAYLVLLYEELGEMSQDIGMDPSVKKEWYDRSTAIQQRLIDKLWNGERFVSHKMDGTEIEKDYGILGYLPVILGKRLPENILEKLIADLKIEGYVLTDYGFDKEKVCARDLCDVACSDVRGYIYQPFNLILISSLYDCGEKEFASEVARRFCDTMVDNLGLSGTLNTFTGAVPGEWLSWNAGAYLLIAGFVKVT